LARRRKSVARRGQMGQGRNDDDGKKMKNDRDAVYVQLIAIMIYNGSSLYRYNRYRSD
jgi:hypothetical protein